MVVVDDVATTGSSLIEAVSALRKKGLKVDMVIVLVDRNEGARQKLKKARCRFVSIFNIEDFKNKLSYPPSQKTTGLPVDECDNYASARCHSPRFAGEADQISKP